MRQIIPAPVIAVVAEIVANRETHATLDSLFMYAGASGDAPPGSKHAKAIEWLRQTNLDESVVPLEILGRLIEQYMDEDLDPDSSISDQAKLKNRSRIEASLGRAKLQYRSGGTIAGALGAPSISLEESIRKKNLPILDDEFARAMRTVETSPREAVSAACNILESVCKIYIEEEGLEMPAKQDLKAVWNIVRKALGFDPSLIEDADLREILTGLIAVANGIGAFRTHASSAHGSGSTRYKLEPRHARLAVHAAHTVVLFVIETWEKRQRDA